jgi:hypothetical protein
MKKIYSKCGTICSQCPSYVDNLATSEDRARCSDGWYTYHGFHYSPEKLVACEGCQPVGENGDGRRYINCLIRRCALHNGVETCAHCAAYHCETLTSRVLGNAWVEELEERLGEIPQEDYDLFVKPYLGLVHLEAIRGNLHPTDITPIKPISIKPSTAAYPQALDSEENLSGLYQLLQRFNAPQTGLTYVQAERHKEVRTYTLKLLWAFGLHGEISEDGTCLVLDHQDYLAKKIEGYYDQVSNHFETLADYGVDCEIVPLNADSMLTPTGYLRRQRSKDPGPPWEVKMTTLEDTGGNEVLAALQTYAKALHEAYGKTAYRRFARADMGVLV